MEEMSSRTRTVLRGISLTLKQFLTVPKCVCVVVWLIIWQQTCHLLSAFVVLFKYEKETRLNALCTAGHEGTQE